MLVSNRLKTILALLLTAAAVYVGVLNLADRLEWEEPEDGIEWIQVEEGVQAGSISRADRLHIEPGDRLLAINGLAIETLDDYAAILEALSFASESFVVDYTVRKAGSETEATYPVMVQLESQLKAADFPLLVVAFFFLGVGLFIFLRNWQAKGAFHFYLICLTAFVLLLLRYSARVDTFDIFIYWISAVTFLLLPPLFLHFCGYFPEPLGWFRQNPQLKYLIYLPAGILGVVHALWFSGQLRVIGLPRNVWVLHWLDRIELLHFLVLFGAAAAILLMSRKASRSVVQRRQMQWITNGTLLGLAPFGLLYGVPYLLNLPISSWMEASILSLAVIPLSFGYAITKYRLMDVELIFKRGVAYVIASSALLAVYVGIALLIAQAIQDMSSDSGFLFLAVSALIVAFLFAPLRDTIQNQIDRYFYKDQYGYRRSFAEFSQTLGSEINLHRLIDKISSRIEKTLNVSNAAIFLRQDASSTRYRRFHLTEGMGGDSLDLPVRLTSRMETEAIISLAASRGREEVIDSELIRHSIYYLAPLKAHGRPIGFLGLGKRLDGDFLTTEDLEMVSTLAGYAAIAIDNAVLYQSLEAKADELSRLKIYNENVIESLTLGVVVITPDAEVTVWNSAMAALTGLEKADAVGRPIKSLFPRELVRSMQEVLGGPGWSLDSPARLYKTHLKNQAGETRLLNVMLSPFVSHNDVNVGTLLIFDDITEKVRLENQLLQAEKLSSIGLFAAGLAHEVNTPLAGIASYTQMLIEETEASDDRRELMQKIEKQCFRASEIVDNLLNFARFSDSDFEEVNLNSLMLDTLSLLEHQFRKSQIDVELDLDSGLPKTVGNGGKLQQVFMNLFINAKDAMPEGGRLQVRTYSQDSNLVIRVEDNGIGISKEDVKRIYDPFFTTKEVGKGTGLGLSISYGILQEHSGRIEVDSSPGRGTTFTLRLPVRRIN